MPIINTPKGSCSTMNDYNRITKEVEETIQKKELLKASPELQKLADEWQTTMKEKLAKIHRDAELRQDFCDVENSMRSWLRTLEREINGVEEKKKSGYMNPTESLQRATQNSQVLFPSFLSLFSFLFFLSFHLYSLFFFYLYSFLFLVSFSRFSFFSLLASLFHSLIIFLTIGSIRQSRQSKVECL